MHKRRFVPILVMLVGAASCRPDAGTPVYDNADDFLDPDGPGVDPVVGPDPYEAGEARLSLGIFYEGEFSEQVSINDMTTNFFIFEGTFSMTLDNTFVAEGFESNRITHAGLGFVGGGVNWMDSRDLSAWTTLYVSLLSEDTAFEDLQIIIQVADGEGTVDASEYGYANNGDWHHLAIPVEDFGDIDLTQVTGPFVFVGGGGDQGERLYIDNVYYTQD